MRLTIEINTRKINLINSNGKTIIESNGAENKLIVIKLTDKLENLLDIKTIKVTRKNKINMN